MRLSRLPFRALPGWAPILPAGLVFAGLFAAPLAYFFVISFWSVRARIMRPDHTLANYVATWNNYGDVLGNTLLIAAVIALLTTAIAFCFAFAIRFKSGRFGDLLLFVTLLTLFGGYLVKIYAWKSILGRDGILNKALLGLGLIDQPLRLLNDKFGWGVLAIQVWKNLPFQLLIIASVLASIRTDIEDAARNLGAGPWQVLRHIILPLSMPGILIAVVLVFIMTFGDFAITRIAGPIYPSSLAVLMHTKALTLSEWNLAACIGMVIIVASLVFVGLYARMARLLQGKAA
jgi:ABC-type spermidine/putrescine transport system permease subunit I